MLAPSLARIAPSTPPSIFARELVGVTHAPARSSRSEPCTISTPGSPSNTQSHASIILGFRSTRVSVTSSIAYRLLVWSGSQAASSVATAQRGV